MYYGLYTASTESVTGCVKRFVTTAHEQIAFPPQVVYYCDLCKESHGFRYLRSIVVDTPRTKRSFEAHCAEQGYETEVDVSSPRNR